MATRPRVRSPTTPTPAPFQSSWSPPRDRKPIASGACDRERWITWSSQCRWTSWLRRRRPRSLPDMLASAPLKSLRDQPYELLAELERRGRNATASPETPGLAGAEWVGVAARMAGELYLVAREEAREVLGIPSPLTRVPGAKPWVLGLASIRGQLFPIIDLRQYLGGGATPVTRLTRIVVVNH